MYLLYSQKQVTGIFNSQLQEESNYVPYLIPLKTKLKFYYSKFIFQRKFYLFLATLNSGDLDQIHQFTYLGTWVNKDGDLGQEIKCRIKQARSVFARMRKMITTHNLSLALRIRTLQYYVWFELLYGCET